MARLYAATGDGIARLDEVGDAWTVEVSLQGSGAQCLVVDPADPEMIYAGLREGGVQRSGDGGRGWVDCDLPEPGVFSLAVSAADGAVYAGTEPSRLFRSDDRGETWRELEALLELPSRPTWSFPPRPWTSHVRWIAPSPHEADLILVGIELGGLMRSTDGGESWQDHRPGAQRDVHSLAWHRHVEGRAYEAGGGGAAWSDDAGDTWRPANEGRDRHYTWSVAVDPDEPERWYVSASTGPFAAHGRGDPQARLYRREGGVWAAGGRAPGAAAGDALCACRRGRPPLRRLRRRPGLGERRSRRRLAPLRASRRTAHASSGARIREHVGTVLRRNDLGSKLVSAEPTRTGGHMAANTLSILKPSVNNLTVRIFVRAAGLDFEELDVWGKKGTPEFLQKDPADLTPLLEEEGLPKGSLWESCAIMQYLCNKHGLDRFYPTDPGERAMTDSAMYYLLATLYPLVARATYPLLGFPQYAGEVATSDADDEMKERGRRDAEAALAKPLDVYRVFFLGEKRFIGGDSPSIADFRFAATLEFLRAIDYDFPAWIEEYLRAMETTVGDAYSEPAADVRGYIEHVKAQRHQESAQPV